MSTQFELVAVEGPAKGRRFSVGAGGMRLGRSSACEITVPDPELSRTHCLFEVREGALWVTDLVSANGTCVNGEKLEAAPRRLSPGDSVSAGRNRFSVKEADDDPSVTGKIDLGLGKKDPQWDGKASADGGDAGKTQSLRYVLWGVAAVSICVSAALFILPPPVVTGGATQDDAVGREVAAEEDKLLSFSFERVEASADAVFRYALSYDGNAFNVQIDDVHGADDAKMNRYLVKTEAADDEDRRRMAEILGSRELYRLAREYNGMPLAPNTLQSISLHVVRSARVFDVSVENKEPPEVLRVVAEKLNEFAKTRFSMWAIQYSVEDLIAKSAEARRAGDVKWDERDVAHGNLAEALKNYSLATELLDTVNPKPADYRALEERRREAKKELDRRFAEQRFRADQVINMKDWNAARRELRVLCEMIPDTEDRRHRDAAAQLRNVEMRSKRR